MKKLSLFIAMALLIAGCSVDQQNTDFSEDNTENNQNSENPQEDSTEDSEGTFSLDPEYNVRHGSMTLTGYLGEPILRECNEGEMCQKTVEYVFFNFSETNADAIYDFIEINAGNAFVANDKVGLGCWEEEENRIYSSNVGDDGVVENVISEEDFEKLQNSSEENPVQLKLTKPLYTSGRGAPECYSHFRDFEVL